MRELDADTSSLCIALSPRDDFARDLRNSANETHRLTTKFGLCVDIRRTYLRLVPSSYSPSSSLNRIANHAQYRKSNDERRANLSSFACLRLDDDDDDDDEVDLSDAGVDNNIEYDARLITVTTRRY